MDLIMRAALYSLDTFIVSCIVCAIVISGANPNRDHRGDNPAKEGSPTLLDPASDCHVPLGVANTGLIPFYWLHSSDGFAYRGRLGRSSAWISKKTLYPDATSKQPHSYSWLQVDLRRPTLVTGLQIQGDPLSENWVTWYSIYYSHDCEIFQPLVDSEGYVGRFHGNSDHDSTATTLLPDPVVSRCIRIVPLRVHADVPALRIELLGCDVRMCREAIIKHTESELSFVDIDSLATIANVSTVVEGGGQEVTRTGRLSLNPTLMNRGFPEFKFPAENIVFGMVLFRENDADTKDSQKDQYFLVKYSRNCVQWEALRETKWVGDPMKFVDNGGRYSTRWYTFPYPVRAQCIRILPISTRYSARRPIKAHFIGCGTGQGTSQTCGLQKRVVQRVKRVIGGSVTAAGDWPWMVSVQIKETDTDYYHICGASIIHPQWLLTALHCVNVMYSRMMNTNDTHTNFTDENFLSNIRIKIGRHSLTSEDDTSIDARPEKIIGHPDFNRSYFIHDVALIKLTDPVRLSDHVGMVCLPHDVTLLTNQSDCRVIGWGKTSKGRLPARPHQVPIRFFEFEKCQAIFSHLNLTTDMLCAGLLDGSADACFGDSGGPMVCNTAGRWYLYGIVSWNIGCALPGYPGVYASVTEHLEWIESVFAVEQLEEKDADQ